MGWCSGTEIFDRVASKILAMEDLSEVRQVDILAELMDAMEEHDWDCQVDSNYFEHPIVKRVVDRLHPEWGDDLLWDEDLDDDGVYEGDVVIHAPYDDEDDE